MWDREKKVGNCKNEFYESEEPTYSKIGDKEEVNKMLYNGNPTLVCASETWAIIQDHDGQNLGILNVGMEMMHQNIQNTKPKL